MSHEREWWQRGSDAQFEETIASMGMETLNKLSAEIAVVQAQIESQRNQGRPDAEWARRARRASATLGIRRKMVKSALSAIHAEGVKKGIEQKRRLTAEMRRRLRDGDVAGSMELLIDFYDPDTEIP